MYKKYHYAFFLVSCLSLLAYANESSKGTPLSEAKSFKTRSFEYYQPLVENDNSPSSSGYHALKNVFLSKELNDSDRSSASARLQDPMITFLLCSEEGGFWRSKIITSRKRKLATDYLHDAVLLALKDGNKVSKVATFDYNPLILEKAAVIFDKKTMEREEISKLNFLINLLPSVVKNLVLSQNKPKEKQTYSFSRDTILDEFAKEAQKKGANQKDLPASFLEGIEPFEPFFSNFETLDYTVVSNKNSVEVSSDKTSVHKRLFGPEDSNESLNGDWLSPDDLLFLAKDEKINGSTLFELDEATKVHCFDFSPDNSFAVQFENEIRCKIAVDKLLKLLTFSSSFLICSEKHWISCLASRNEGGILSLIVTDSKNLDRNEDPALKKLMSFFDDTTTPQEDKKTDSKASQDFLKSLLDGHKEGKKDENKEEPVNYDAPLANISLDELPSLQELFGGKVTNNIQLILNQLKSSTTPSGKLAKLKNGLVLYGPPGTGKSTIAQVIARLAGREVIYAGGGDFRTAYQGSSKAKLDALFAEAKKRNKPCVIIIDEIDGTSAKTYPNSSTQEDNRAIKALITTLDQYRNDPSIYVICTTNYPDKIDPAILRRFTSLEIALPNYKMRENIVHYYLRKNGIEVTEHGERGVSREFIEMFLTASEGFSGDALGDIINNAILQEESGLSPEDAITLWFRYNTIDPFNRSIAESIGRSVVAPLMPLAHLLDGYTTSDLDKHIYSQFKRHQKLKADIEHREKMDDPFNRKKDSWPVQFAKTGGYLTAQAVTTAAFGFAIPRLLVAGWTYLTGKQLPAQQ